jgi:arsenate reductase-like glutaredoxin family protein
LETHDVEVLDTIPASRKLGLLDAVALVGQADRLVVAKGKKLTELDLNLESPTDDVVTKLMLGPTGNLRAPTLRVGRTLVVGYNEQVMMETFG